jgi:hypothetical protein
MVHAFDIVVSSVGIMSLGDGRGSTATHTETDPMKILNNGYVVSISLAAVIFSVLTRWLLFVPEAPYAWLHYLGAGAVGMATSDFVEMKRLDPMYRLLIGNDRGTAPTQIDTTGDLRKMAARLEAVQHDVSL